jgi:hypothetical protein
MLIPVTVLRFPTSSALYREASRITTPAWRAASGVRGRDVKEELQILFICFEIKYFDEHVLHILYIYNNIIHALASSIGNMFVRLVFDILSEHCKMIPIILFLTQLSSHCCISAGCNSIAGRGREQQTEHVVMTVFGCGQPQLIIKTITAFVARVLLKAKAVVNTSAASLDFRYM